VDEIVWVGFRRTFFEGNKGEAIYRETHFVGNKQLTLHRNQLKDMEGSPDDVVAHIHLENCNLRWSFLSEAGFIKFMDRYMEAIASE
jgi:hypothetical protein